MERILLPRDKWLSASSSSNDFVRNASLINRQRQQLRRKLLKAKIVAFLWLKFIFPQNINFYRSYFSRKEETTYKLFIVLNFQHQNFSVHCSIWADFSAFVCRFALVSTALTNFTLIGISKRFFLDPKW